MRQFSIAERLIAVALLPIAAMLAVPYLSGALLPILGEANAIYGHIVVGLGAIGLAGAAILAIVRSMARPLAAAADTIDAIAAGELVSAPPLPPSRSELARLLSATDRLAEVLGERQRRELVHNDLDRTWQASRRVNLANLAR